MKGLLRNYGKTIFKTSLKSVAMIVIFTALISCASHEFHRTPKQVKGQVMVGTFTLRNMDFAPFLVRDFIDVLSLEFFKSGYLVKHRDLEEAKEKKSAIKELCQKFNCDYYVGGVVSSHELGFLLDREMQSRISFQVYSSKGDKLGEASYCVDKNFADRAVQEDCAETFVDDFTSKMGSPR